MAMTKNEFVQEIKIALAEAQGLDVKEIKDADIVGYRKICAAYQRANQLTGLNVKAPEIKLMRVDRLIADICETFEVTD